ncbi:LLM class flavin-dependent oxidoreductase [Halobacteriales archaeon Cl-PHB]
MVEKGVRLPLPSEQDWSNCIEFAEQADAAGIDTVWVPETWGRNSVILSTQVADRVESADICSGIFNIYSRTPALMAMTAAGLADVTEGQFRLGLGTSGPAVVENFHGVEFDQPLRRTREYVEIVDAFVSGDRVDYDGDIFDLDGFALDPPTEHDVPIYVAAMGENNLRLTGEFADGWLPIFVPLGEFEQAYDAMENGAQRRDRSVDDIHIAPYVIACISEDEPDEARRLVKQAMSFYIGAMGDFYYNTVKRFGYADGADAVREHWENGDHAASADAVTEEMVDDFSLAGTPEHAADRLQQYYDEGVDMPVAYMPPKAPAEFIRETIDHFAAL